MSVRIGLVVLLLGFLGMGGCEGGGSGDQEGGRAESLKGTGIPITAKPQVDIRRLKYRLTTTSQHAYVLITGGTFAVFVGQVLEGGAAPQLFVNPDVLGPEIVNPSGSKIVVDFEVYLNGTAAVTLMHTIQHGSTGSTKVEIFVHDSTSAQSLGSFTGEASGDPLNPVEYPLAIPAGQVSLPPKSAWGKKVLAFYYPWYGFVGGHWDSDDPDRGATHTPLAGYYDSNDPIAIKRQIDEAKQAGIDSFIASWWGQGSYEDNAFKKCLSAGVQEGFSFSVYYEVPSFDKHTKEQIAEDFKYILKNYGMSPAFLKVQGAPVIFVYGVVTGSFGKADWQYVIQQLDQEGLNYFLIGEGLHRGYLYDAFQGVHSYTEAYVPLAQSQFWFKVSSCKARFDGRLFAATAHPGFDPSGLTLAGEPAPTVDAHKNGLRYREMWDASITSDPDWILISTWNEWHEGSEIEPSVEMGNQRLQITFDYTGYWKNGISP